MEKKQSIEKQNKNAILLVRVSTTRQEYEAQVYDLQIFAKEKGFTKFHAIETKETGLAEFDEKIGTNELFKYYEKNPDFNTVFITELSRIGRRQSILHVVKDWFIKNKIQLYAKDHGFALFENGLVTPKAEMSFSIFSMLAESEMKQKMERSLRKRKELMAKGISISGPTLFGYAKQKVKEGERKEHIKHEKNAEIVIQIFNFYLNGIHSSEPHPSIKRIAEYCIENGFPKYTHSKRNINKLLKEEAYTGSKTTVNDNQILYPAIIPLEKFERIQKKMNSKTQLSRNSKHTTVLSNLISCPGCGRKLSANYRYRAGIGSHSYRCTSRSDTNICTTKTALSMSLLDSAIWSTIKFKSTDLFRVINTIKPSSKLLELENQLQNVNQKSIEIQNELNNRIETINGLSSTSHKSVAEMITTQAKKVRNLEKKLSALENQKINLEDEKRRFQNLEDHEDFEKFYLAEINSSEQSQSTIKAYINYFVEEIIIIEHNYLTTNILVKLKDFSNTKNLIIEKKQKHFILQIDKKITQKPRLLLIEKRLSQDYINDKYFKTLNFSNFGEIKNVIEIPFSRLTKIYEK
jgi:DNA invertase Pin-like site-specific DNA recombinase